MLELKDWPTLNGLVQQFDGFLSRTWPDFFGTGSQHPFTSVKPYKVIHDNLWGTNRFSWRELAVIDSPLLQRLRGIHQTGLAYYVYPCAQHTRFEHSLGVTTVASKAFDAIAQRHLRDFETIANDLKAGSAAELLGRLREELRLAALIHDIGHSMHSHASEQVYQELPLMQEAIKELRTFVGRNKGAGEVISFCFARTEALQKLLKRALERLPDQERRNVQELDFENISLLVVGRTRHPYLQFMADIISSDLDADKLDYLLRDASAAGLPLRYDLERYLYLIGITKEVIPDGEGYLEKLYETIGTAVARQRPNATVAYPYYESYRLRLPREAMNTIEQIVICKFMLFSYIYHHRKVRAGEGLLAKALREQVRNWKAAGKSDAEILEEFLTFTDSSLDRPPFRDGPNSPDQTYARRIQQRLLPREVYGFVGSKFSHAEGGLLRHFISVLLDKAPRTREENPRQRMLEDFERILGQELYKSSKEFANPTDALHKTGAWLDAPKPPKFENINFLIGGLGEAIPLSEIFPIQYWIQAYESHRYYVRIFAFSEYFDLVKQAARTACEQLIGVTTDSFYEAAERKRK